MNKTFNLCLSPPISRAGPGQRRALGAASPPLGALLLLLLTCSVYADTWSSWLTITNAQNDTNATYQLLVKHDSLWQPDSQWGVGNITQLKAFRCQENGVPIIGSEADAVFRRAMSSLIVARRLHTDVENTAEYCPFVPIDHGLLSYTVSGVTYNYVVPYTSSSGWQGNCWIWRSVADYLANLPGSPALGIPLIASYEDQNTRVNLYCDALTRAVYQMDRNYQVPSKQQELADTARKLAALLEPISKATDVSAQATADLTAEMNALQTIGGMAEGTVAAKTQGEMVVLCNQIDKVETTLSDSTVLNFVRNHFTTSQISSINKLSEAFGLGMKVLKGLVVGYDVAKYVSNATLYASLYDSVVVSPQVEERIQALATLDRTSITNAYDPAFATAIDQVITQFYQRKALAATFDISAYLALLPPESQQAYWDAIGTGTKFAIDVIQPHLTKAALPN